jgi:hypothetical protein
MVWFGKAAVWSKFSPNQARARPISIAKLSNMKLPSSSLFLQKPFHFSALLESLRQPQAGKG